MMMITPTDFALHMTCQGYKRSGTTTITNTCIIHNSKRLAVEVTLLSNPYHHSAVLHCCVAEHTFHG